jgi:GNAT superfamily N-acetyltransferase
MSEPKIRRAVKADIPYFYEICLKTGNAGKDAADLFYDPHLIGQYYAAPYMQFHDGICYTVEMGHLPQGYIVAAPDTLAFKRWMEDEWLQPLRARYPKPVPQEMIRSEAEKKIYDKIFECHSSVDEEDMALFREYPAHLHIDLLPALQGKGMGRALMHCLFDELSKRNARGVHLQVGIQNQGAAAFYKKLGFTVLSEEDWGYTMGKSVS